MKTSFASFAALIGLSLISCSVQAQLGKIKIEKPKIEKPKIETPKVEIGGNNGSSNSNSGSNNNSTTSKAGLGGTDASGLFTNISNDPSANSHREGAVENLKKIEAEYAKPSVNYSDLGKWIADTDKRLGFVKKLEPNCNDSKFVEKYKPFKERADKELAAYGKATELEKTLSSKFRPNYEATKTEFDKPSVNDYRTANGRYSARPCYCSKGDENKSNEEYNKTKAEYDALVKQLVGYKNEDAQNVFSEMDICQKNANKYAVWASKDNVKADIEAFNQKNWEAEPKQVIDRCDRYFKGLERIETDPTIAFEAATKTALAEGKTQVAKFKTDAETYISSGKYQIYLDKVHKEKIAKVFMPKAVTKNATLEQGAINYIKDTEYTEYVGKEEAVASTFRAVTLTKEPIVAKNEYDLPKWQYHEIWVAYKGKDGKCYKVAVYASYTYKGGGTYATTPTWGADRPEEMACDNVNK